MRSIVERPTPLNFKRVTVEVGDGHAKEGGLFAAGFISYRIRVQPLGYEVRRKDADFAFLRKILVRQNPQVAVPPCTVTSAAKAVPKIIERRERYFTRFL